MLFNCINKGSSAHDQALSPDTPVSCIGLLENFTHSVIQLNLCQALSIHPNVMFTFFMGIVGIGQGYTQSQKKRTMNSLTSCHLNLRTWPITSYVRGM